VCVVLIGEVPPDSMLLGAVVDGEASEPTPNAELATDVVRERRIRDLLAAGPLCWDTDVIEGPPSWEQTAC
jgi:hypothetical protein